MSPEKLGCFKELVFSFRYQGLKFPEQNQVKNRMEDEIETGVTLGPTGASGTFIQLP